MIATVSSTTRMSAETIGQSFKTMLTRIEQVKAGGIDETGQSLNNVEKTLSSVGISLRDATDSFRPLGDVMTDIAGRWSSFNEIQRAQIANSIAGVRQANIFLTLMTHYGDVQKYMTAQTESAGLAQNRYAIYLQSVEAAQNKLTASWERLWQVTIKSGNITWFLNLASSMLDIASAGGGLIPILTAVLGIFIKMQAVNIANIFRNVWINLQVIQTTIKNIGFTQTFKYLVSGLNATTAAAEVTGAAMNTVLGIAGIALTAISLIFMAVKNHAEEAARKTQELTNSISDLTTKIDQINEQKRTIFALGEEFTTLKNKINSGMNLSTDDQQKFLDIQNKIHEILPQVAGAYNEEGNYILDESVNLQKLIDLKNEELAIDQAKLQQQTGEKIKYETEQYVKQINALATYIAPSRNRAEAGKIIDPAKVEEQRLKIRESLNSIKQDYISLTEDQQKATISMLKNMGDAGEAVIKELTGTAEIAGSSVLLSIDPIKQGISQYLGLADAIKGVGDTLKTLNDVIAKSEEGKFGFSDIEALSKAYPDYLDALSVEGDKLTLNTDKVREYAIAQAQAAVETAKAAGATQEEIDILQAQADQLSRSISLSGKFVETFNQIIQATSTGLSGDAKEKFDQFGNSIGNINNQFEKGQIDTKQYFDLLQQELSQADFKSMFEGNQQAADSFFSGMVLNAANSLTQISSMFDAGKINIAEYTSQLSQVSGIFETIGNIVATSGEQMGMTNEQIDKIKGSTDSLTESVANMNSMQEVNNLLVSMNSDNLQFNSDKYADYARAVADAMAASGQAWTDAAGNALNGADAIYKYATAADGNMSVLASQAAGKTNGVIQTVARNVAGMLRNLADAIRNFKGGISLTPRLVGGINFDAIIGGQPIQNWFQMPQIQLDIAGTGGLSFANIASSIESFAGGIENTVANLNLDLSVYMNPQSVKSGSDAANSLATALNKAAGGASNTKKAVDELKKSLDDAKKAAVDSLKNQLKAYKDIIDERKKLLDSMEKEAEYQDEIADKNKGIAKIQNELAALQFDTSEEGNARRLQLQDELTKSQKELEITERKHSIDTQKSALDKDYSAFEKQINDAIAKVQAISATSLKDFASQLAEVLSQISMPFVPTTSSPTAIPTFHEGGIIGQAIKSNEVLAKLMNGELVVTQAQAENFMQKTLPQLAQSTSTFNGGNISVEMPITVGGSLDKSVLPDLEKLANKVVEKINASMLGRGYNRRADLFSAG